MKSATLKIYLKRGSEPTLPVVAALAHAANVSATWLAFGTNADKLAEEYIFIPRYDVKAAAGAGAIVNSERIVDHIAVKAEWVHRRLGADPNHLLLIEAMGDSMAPAIDDGDLLLVDTREPRFRDDGVYVIGRDGDLSVKRLRRRAGGILVISSDNSIYGSEEVKADTVRIVGRVIWAGGKL